MLSAGVRATPLLSKWREIPWTQSEYLTRDASHQSKRIEIWKGRAHEHVVFPCLTHMFFMNGDPLPNSQYHRHQY